MSHALMPITPPSVVVVNCPFDTLRNGVAVKIGSRIDQFADPKMPVMARLNDQWLLREHWHMALAPGDVLEVHLLPQGGGGGGSDVLRMVLQIAAAVAIMAWAGPAGFSAWQTGLLKIGLVMASNMAINVLLPVNTGQFAGGAGPQAKTVYNTSLSGNQARLDAPIPVLYGRNKTYPDFASQPYSNYDNANDDQYYHALLCVGMGSYAINPQEVFLDDTPISTFAGVEFNILAPGEQPRLVLANVETAVEVSNQELKSGEYTGGFTANKSLRRAYAVAFDFTLNGLGVAGSGGAMTDKSVTVQMEIREINDFGVPLGNWTIIDTQTITAATTSTVRRSYGKPLARPMRVQARVVRKDLRDDSQLVRNDIFWTGLRTYLQTETSLAVNATHIEVRMKANEQLNGLSQNKIGVISQRLLPTWSPDVGWSEMVATRSIAWAIADKWKNSEYGDGLTDSRCDLQTLYDLDQVWAARQDKLDIVFDTRTTSEEADQMMARAGRARVFKRNGVRTIARDQKQDLPVTAYGANTIMEGSSSIEYLTDVRKIADAIIVEYFDQRDWDWHRITCPAPGVTTPKRPEVWRLPGVVGSKQAEREGLYEAAARYYRRRFASWKTELQGLIPAFGSAVVFAPPLRGWGQSGDVVSWDEDRVVVVSEPVEWLLGTTHYISFVNDDGSLADPIEITPGEDSLTVLLATAPIDPLVFDDPTRERTRYVLGTLTQGDRKIVRVLAAAPSDMREDGSMIIEMRGVVEDDRVHEADNALLPSPGEIQDPVETAVADAGGGGGTLPLPVVNLRDHSWAASIINAPDTPTYVASFTFSADGHLVFTDLNTVVTSYADEWVLAPPVEPLAAHKLEVKVDLASSAMSPADGLALGGPTGSWLPLDTSRAYTFTIFGGTASASATWTAQIRIAASGLVQAVRTFNISFVRPGSGGGAGGFFPERG